MKKVALIFLLTLPFSAIIAQTRYIDDVFTGNTKTADIKYGQNINATGQNTNLLMDVYQPAGDTASKRPVLIMAHEGSFIFGDKADTYMVDFANRMTKKGYVVACITYRKGWVPNATGTEEENTRAILPAAWRAIQDFKAAVRFFRNDAATSNTYKINPDWIVGGGFGAGAYLPVNGQIIDLPSEFNLNSLQKKQANGQVSGEGPYIDTTQAGLGGIYNTASGSPGYSFRVPLVLIYSGATIDTLLFDNGENPLAIACHGSKDETTPYKTAIVNAQAAPNVLVPIVKVHGTYHITRELDAKGKNIIFNDVNSDGFPQVMIPDNKYGPMNMYKKGVYTFIDETYMPWDQNQDAYASTYSFYMDTLVRYTAPRIHKALNLSGNTGIAGAAYKPVSVYPNPSSGDVYISMDQFKGESYDLFLYDPMGRSVFSEKQVKDRIYTLNRKEFAPSIYLLKIETEENVRTAKVVFE